MKTKYDNSVSIYMTYKDFILNKYIPVNLKKDTYTFARDIVNITNKYAYFYNLDDLIEYMHKTTYSENIYKDVYIKFDIYAGSKSKLESILEKLFTRYKISDISFEYIREKIKYDIYKSLFINYSNEIQLEPKQGYAYDIIAYWNINEVIKFDRIKNYLDNVSKYYSLPQNILELIKANLLDTIVRLKYKKDPVIGLNPYYILYEDSNIIICFHRFDDISAQIVIFYNLRYVKSDFVAPLLCTIELKTNDYIIIKTNPISYSNMAIIVDKYYDKIVTINNNQVIHIIENLTT